VTERKSRDGTNQRKCHLREKCKKFQKLRKMGVEIFEVLSRRLKIEDNPRTKLLIEKDEDLKKNLKY
jgi:hypothetical protein